MKGRYSDRAEPVESAEGWFPLVVLGFGAITGVVWAGASLAAALASQRSVAFSDAGYALLRLPSNASDPAAAWPDPSRSAMPGPALYWACQLVVLAAAVAIAVIAGRVWKHLNAGPKGSLGVVAEAGFAARRDLAGLTVASPQPGRLTIGTSSGRLLACEPQASLAVVGPTGCGKTAGFAIPALLEWEGPVIATSVKSDLLAATIAHRRKGDRKVWVYDPTGSSGSSTSTWSPLAACTTWAGATRMAAWMAEAAQPRLDTVADGDYWYSQARKGLAPYLFAAATSGADLGTVVQWVDTQEQADVKRALQAAADRAIRNSDTRWQWLYDQSLEVYRELITAGESPAPQWIDREPEQWPASVREGVAALVDAEWEVDVDRDAPDVSTSPLAPLVAARALWSKEPRLRGSVFATMENVLAGWADPGVTAAAGSCELDLADWLSGDNTIYVVAPAHEQSRLRPVLTVLVQQAIRAAYDTANANGGRLSKPCLVLLDEAGNIAPLRDLPGYASTARSHGITFVTVWQDLAQIRAAYRDRALTVLNNHRAKLFGTGIADDATLEYVSRLIGDESRTERNVASDLRCGRRTVSEHQTHRRAAPVDVLRRIRPEEAVLLYGSELPVHVRLRPWFRDRHLRRRADPNSSPTTDRRRARALLHR